MSILFWAAVTFFALTSILYIISLVFEKELNKIALLLGFFGWLCLTLYLIWRGIAQGHLPIVNRFESMTVALWFAAGIFLLTPRLKMMKFLGAGVFPLVFLLLGWAGTLPKQMESLSPGLQSYWLYIHALFGELDVGSFLIGTGAALLLILKKKGKLAALKRNLSLVDLDKISYRFIFLGFIFHSIMIASGAIWANVAWGRYWGWDPIETWSLITWLVYALYLHLRSTFNWRNEKAAWWALACFLLVLFNFWGVGYLYATIHAYSH